MPSYFITMGGTLCTRVTSLPSTDVIKPHHLTNVSSNGSNPQPPLPPFGPSRMPTSGSSRLSLNPSSWQRSVSSISRQNYPANVAKKLPRIPRACSGEGQEGSGQKAGATSVSSDSESLPPNPSPSSTSPLDTSPSDPLSVCVMRTAILTCPGHVADALMDALLSLGASTCSIEDANTGTEAEQEIYSSGPIPWDPSGPRSLWNQTRLRAFFPANQSEGDIRSTVARAAAAVQWGGEGWGEEADGEAGGEEEGGGEEKRWCHSWEWRRWWRGTGCSKCRTRFIPYAWTRGFGSCPRGPHCRMSLYKTIHWRLLLSLVSPSVQGTTPPPASACAGCGRS
ncbi:hypothetical protein CLOP_g20140 [Closterium sp. NIES-67]|nr:hypothetical protein CLOP_g20140 [Closterium sp. NIES-67]